MGLITKTPEEQLIELKRGAFEILPEEELLKKLKKSYEKHSIISCYSMRIDFYRQG